MNQRAVAGPVVPDHAEHAVGAEPARRSQSRDDELGGQVERAVGVGQDDEVVLGAVTLEVPHGTRLELRGPGTAWVPGVTGTPRQPGPWVSSQRTLSARCALP